MRKLACTLGLLMATAPMALAQETKSTTTLDQGLPEYKATQGVSGKIVSIGSDTMNNVMAHWMEEFKKLYPSVTTEMEGKGSSTAPPALIKGQSQFAPMSREMKASEIADFEKAFGYKPTAFKASIDALAIFVHKDCPMSEISLEQAKKVFSVAGPDLTWGDLGVKDEKFKGKPVQLYGRNSSSGTYAYFKEHALGGADFKSTVKEQPGSSSVVQAIASDQFAMGYSGIGYRTAGVKMLKLKKGSDAAVEGTYEACLSGEYPLARFLYVYVNKDPNKPLDPLRAEFIKMMFSKAGQEAVTKDGYFPVTAEIAKTETKKAGL